VKLGPKFQAHGVDLDPEPIEYGKESYLTQLSTSQKARVEIHWANVLEAGLPRADVVCALNFSFFIFKQRATMLTYFKNVYATLNPGGIFVTDCFGGSQCFGANEEDTEHRTHTYYWDQVNFDPVTNEAMFHIHFKLKGQKKTEKVFTYDWRMWSIPEIREMMAEAGFKKTYVYWEGTTRNGEGDGNFKQVTQGEECEAWIAYVVGSK
jgi:cyclopropane fatty-acyl-phospholipid synthase-like methyltransferase